jgi:hypothetical protein
MTERSKLTGVPKSALTQACKPITFRTKKPLLEAQVLLPLIGNISTGYKDR